MTPYALVYALHVLAALAWVGGMFFAWCVLRPAALSSLEAPARLTLWVDVLQRFFVWVWVAVLILPISGMGLVHLRFNGFETLPRYVQIMMGLFLAMLALFLRVRLLALPALKIAVAEQNWAAGGTALSQVRRLVGFNLLIGVIVVALAAARPTF